MITFNGVGFGIVDGSSGDADVEFLHSFLKDQEYKGWSVVGIDYGWETVVRYVVVDKVFHNDFCGLSLHRPSFELPSVAIDDSEDGQIPVSFYMQ